jgi:hypothetical protein
LNAYTGNATIQDYVLLKAAETTQAASPLACYLIAAGVAVAFESASLTTRLSGMP